MPLDGWNELNKNRIYLNGDETFYDVFHALSLLKKHKVKTSISCTVSKDNYLYLDKIVDFFKIGVKGIAFDVILDDTAKDYAVSDAKQLAYYLFKAFKKAVELGISEDRIGRRIAEPFFKEIPKFYDCPALGLCGGRCAYDVFTKTGKLGFIDENYCTFMKEVIKYLISYYYDTMIENIDIKFLTVDYFDQFKSFLDSLKREKGVLIDVSEIKDVERFMKGGVFGNERNLGRICIAVDKSNNKVVGFYDIGMEKKRRGRWEVGLAVDKKYRYQGIGSLLLNDICKEAGIINVDVLHALVKSRNKPSIELLKKNGFKLVGKEESDLLFVKHI